jgi:membrane-associated phospholipid phosphatase
MMSLRIRFLIFLFIPLIAYSQNIDIKLLRSINSPDPLPSDNYYRFLSNSDAYFVITVPVAMGVTGLLKHDEKLFRNACVTAASTIVNSGVASIIKYSVHRDRPYVTYPDIIGKSPSGKLSFPSGHTSQAFATATSVSLAYPKWYVIVPSYAWASSVGYSRMHLGVHYPSDVLAGAIIGSGCAWITHRVNKKLLAKK